MIRPTKTKKLLKAYSKKCIHLLLLSMITLSSINLIGQDWPSLQRYKTQNDSLLQLPFEKNRVVFMGNSITEGWDHHYPAFMRDKPYVNRGISGQTTPQMLCRFRQDVIDLDPHTVVILAGTNDIAGNTGPSTDKMITDNIMSMAELASKNDIQVIICSIIPVHDYPWAKGKEPNTRIPAINNILKNYCVDNSFIFLDYFQEMATPDNGLIEVYTYDGVHPNKEGYLLMAKLTTEAIEKSFSNK